MSLTLNRLFAGAIFICAACGDATADALLQDEAGEGLTAMVEVVDGSIVIVIDELNQQRLGIDTVRAVAYRYQLEIRSASIVGRNAKRASDAGSCIRRPAIGPRRCRITRLAIHHGIVDA
jgi:hypothetical protein